MQFVKTQTDTFGPLLSESKSVSNMECGRGKFVLLDELLKVTCDWARLRDECLNVLGAGRTSTAALIQWIVYFLARHS